MFNPYVELALGDTYPVLLILSYYFHRQKQETNSKSRLCISQVPWEENVQIKGNFQDD